MINVSDLPDPVDPSIFGSAGISVVLNQVPFA